MIVVNGREKRLATKQPLAGDANHFARCMYLVDFERRNTLVYVPRDSTRRSQSPRVGYFFVSIAWNKQEQATVTKPALKPLIEN